MAKSEATLLLKIKAVGEEALSRTSDLLGGIGKLAAVGFAAAVGAAAGAVAAYKESEAATNALNQSLIQQGVYSKDLKEKYAAMGAELQRKTKFDDDAATSAQAVLQGYLKELQITPQLMKATADLATAKGIDLASAATLVGKSIGTSTNALGREGIELDKNATSSQKLALVTEALNGKFGGQAEAAAQGLGSLDQMKNALGNLAEAAGGRLAPMVTLVAQAITSFANELLSNQTVVNGFTSVIQGMAQGGVIVKNIFMGVGEVIKNVFGAQITAITQLMDGNFKQAYESMRGGFSAAADGIVARNATMKEEMTAVDAAFANQKVAEDEADIARITASETRKAEIHTLSNEQKLAAQEALLLAQQEKQKKYDAQIDAIFAARDQAEIQRLTFQEQFKTNKKLLELNAQIAAEQNQTKKLELESQKRKLIDEEFTKFRRDQMTTLEKLEDTMQSKSVQTFEKGMNALVKLQNSKSKELAAIGKAAALASISIETAKGATAAYASLAGIPIVGPALGAVAAAAVIAYGAEQFAAASGVNLAEGGIVRATTGGVNATIGEGGRDEAVIPLEDGDSPIGGGNKIYLTVYGGLLGDEIQAKEFAIAVDRELLRLRQTNQSLAFDEGII